MASKINDSQNKIDMISDRSNHFSSMNLSCINPQNQPFSKTNLRKPQPSLFILNISRHDIQLLNIEDCVCLILTLEFKTYICLKTFLHSNLKYSINFIFLLHFHFPNSILFLHQNLCCQSNFTFIKSDSNGWDPHSFAVRCSLSCSRNNGFIG